MLLQTQISISCDDVVQKCDDVVHVQVADVMILYQGLSPLVHVVSWCRFDAAIMEYIHTVSHDDSSLLVTPSSSLLPSLHYPPLGPPPPSTSFPFKNVFSPPSHLCLQVGLVQKSRPYVVHILKHTAQKHIRIVSAAFFFCEYLSLVFAVVEQPKKRWYDTAKSRSWFLKE